MTNKITSAQAHEEMSRLGDKVLQQDLFDREDIQSALEALGGGIGAEVPSGKSYLDWARREGLVETVSRGTYRWAVVTEQVAAEVGQEIAAGVDPEPNSIVVTDMDPENPMILNLTIDGVPRLPRKMKKRMKRDLTANTSARKVNFSFAGADR